MFTLNEQGAGFSVYALVNDKPFGEQVFKLANPQFFIGLKCCFYFLIFTNVECDINFNPGVAMARS